MKSTSSLQFKRYTKKELLEAIRVLNVCDTEGNKVYPKEQKNVVNNYLALQKIVDLQQQLIDKLERRYEKTGKMIQGIFQRRYKDGDNIYR